MRLFLNLFTLVLSLILLVSCGSSKEPSLKSRNQEDVMFIPSEDTIIFAHLGEIPTLNPNTVINAYRLEDNILYLEVSYSGGCKLQDFAIFGDTLIYNDKVPLRKIILYRDSKGDLCREWITRELWFNLEQLAPKNEVGSRVTLILEGIDAPLYYMLK